MKPDYSKWLKSKNEVHSEEKERIWKEAQKCLLEELYGKLEEDMEELMAYRYGATGAKASLVRYIGSLNSEYKHRRKYLEDGK